LRRRYYDSGWKMRAEPSDNLSEWLGVTVEVGRVTKFVHSKYTIGEPLTGTIPAEIGALDGLTYLNLRGNQICGHLPSEIGRLTSLKHLWIEDNRLEGPLPAELGALTALTEVILHNNNFSGKIPSTLANLTKVQYLRLHDNNFDTDVPPDCDLYFKFDSDVLIGCGWKKDVAQVKKEVAQEYLATLRPNHAADK